MLALMRKIDCLKFLDSLEFAIKWLAYDPIACHVAIVYKLSFYGLKTKIGCHDDSNLFCGDVKPHENFKEFIIF